ncbi:MAG TPA: PIG-L family deacetylase [Candidatus Aminicenantes bacterium]|nr:PIG-L family deacetylase [Candidatus Aminicenantes bacterium]HRY64389.1 PIG-L family deacetylase [Candidatus Aminicenantes bacterium]HRZ71302.1 PIG-L family deacetylase [Candidatus Aminicenantes bacterium]
MMKRAWPAAAALAAVSILFLLRPAGAGASPADDGKPRIICIGAHPDDAESGAAGTAALWIAKGYHVKFVSVTNGDIGHWRDSGPELARRRKAEVEHGAGIVGYDFEVLDNHDGELQPTLENRKAITRLIREWKADVVITHRPNDYHPDHRYTSVLVQDSAYMVTVPKLCPEVPALKANPVFLYFSDDFQKPNPFQADIAVGIDAVMDKKLEVILGMVSQLYEGGVSGSPELLTGDPAKRKERLRMLRQRSADGDMKAADRFRRSLEAWYGRERAAKILYAEAFEISEYGRTPDKAEIMRLFPFY